MRLTLLPASLLVAFLACATPVRAQPHPAETPHRTEAKPPPPSIRSLRMRILYPTDRLEGPEPSPPVAPIRLALPPALVAEEEDEDSDVWSYVAGGVLLVHAVVAAVLIGIDDTGSSGGDDEPGFPLPPGRPE